MLKQVAELRIEVNLCKRISFSREVYLSLDRMLNGFGNGSPIMSDCDLYLYTEDRLRALIVDLNNDSLER